MSDFLWESSSFIFVHLFLCRVTVAVSGDVVHAVDISSVSLSLCLHGIWLVSLCLWPPLLLCPSDTETGGDYVCFCVVFKEWLNTHIHRDECHEPYTYKQYIHSLQMNENWVFNYSNKVDITINKFEVGIYLFNRFWKMCLFSPRLQLFI